MMSLPRFTIATSMTIVLVVAVGFAALRNANPFWASASWTVAVLSVSVALGGALLGGGARRTFRAGYAVTGSVCLIVWLAALKNAGSLSGRPRLLAFWAFRSLQPYVNPEAVSGMSYIYYGQVSSSLQVIPLSLVGALVCRLVVVRDERSTP